MDHMELAQGYEEVQPLINTIREQHADIIQRYKDTSGIYRQCVS